MGNNGFENPLFENNFTTKPLPAPGTFTGTKVDAADPDYSEWLRQGKKLAADYQGRQWAIGDWLVTGAEHFDWQEVMGDVPSYLMLANNGKETNAGFHTTRPPNFYRTVAAELGLAYQTIKNLAYVARTYSKKQRVQKLSFSHHAVAAPYEDRADYLKACFDVNGTIHTVDWLRSYIDKEEGNRPSRSTRALSFRIQLPLWEDLHIAAKLDEEDFREVIQKVCQDAIRQYVADHADVIKKMKSGKPARRKKR